MTLEPLTGDDLPLIAELETDPVVMKELGGPLPYEAMRAKLDKRLRLVAEGKAIVCKIMTDGVAAGFVCLWESEHGGTSLSEIGWMLKPAYQGRGLGTAATRALIERARAEKRWGALHAYTSVTNVPSNAICRKLGFALVGEEAVDYSGRSLRAAHWRLDP
jgi:RimJ/RimL family protein N-acetyltransferase